MPATTTERLDGSSHPCRCERALICERCWRDFERSLTERQLRDWLALWDRRDQQQLDEARD